jgi:chromosome segregation ATPase
MFDPTHKDHKFEHLQKVYDRHVQDIRVLQEDIKKRLEEHSRCMAEIEQTIEEVQKAKEDKANEITMVMEQICARLDTHMKNKLMTLLAHKGVIADEIDYLEGVTSDINKEVSRASKSSLVSRFKHLTSTIEAARQRPPAILAPPPGVTDFPYRCHCDR